MLKQLCQINEKGSKLDAVNIKKEKSINLPVAVVNRLEWLRRVFNNLEDEYAM